MELEAPLTSTVSYRTDESKRSYGLAMDQHSPPADVSDSSLSRLPQELLLLCLTSVPRGYHHVAQAVCREWRTVIRSSEFYEMRKALNHSEPWLYVSTRNPDATWKVYNPETCLWMRLPSLPTHMHENYGTVVIGSKLFVIGGYDSTCEEATNQEMKIS